MIGNGSVAFIVYFTDQFDELDIKQSCSITVNTWICWCWLSIIVEMNAKECPFTNLCPSTTLNEYLYVTIGMLRSHVL